MAFLNSVFQRADTFIQRIGEVVAPVEGPAQELQIAIRKHDWPTTQRLLQENFFGGDALNQPLGSDCTPLHLAAEADFVPCVEYLLDEGADVDARTRSTHETPLHKAGRAGAMQAAQVLVNRGASIVARDNMRRTAYDVSSNLALRQWLLPLQMRAEAEEPSSQAAAAPPPQIGAPPTGAMPSYGAPQMSAASASGRYVDPGYFAAPPTPPAARPSAPHMTAAPPPPLASPPPPVPAAAPMVAAAPPPPMPAAPQPPSPLRPASAPLPQSSPMRPAATSAQSSPLRPAGQAPAQFQAFTAFKAGGPLRQAAPQPPPPPPAQQPTVSPQFVPRAAAPPAPGPPLQSAPAPLAPPAPTPQAETGERYAFCNRRVDAIGRRYADGFHSSASDPSLKAKYGNAKADYSHLPPPPTFGAPPPPPPPASY